MSEYGVGEPIDNRDSHRWDAMPYVVPGDELSPDAMMVLRWLADAGEDGLTTVDLADHAAARLSSTRVSRAGLGLMSRRMAVMTLPKRTLAGKRESARLRITGIGRSHIARAALKGGGG